VIHSSGHHRVASLLYLTSCSQVEKTADRIGLLSYCKSGAAGVVQGRSLPVGRVCKMTASFRLSEVARMQRTCYVKFDIENSTTLCLFIQFYSNCTLYEVYGAWVLFESS
jgi:hypothetical protein